MLLTRKSGCKITTFPSIHKIFSSFFVILHPEMSKQALSILIPTYNTVCVKLVEVLSQQAQALNVTYEIIVSDDASPNRDTVAANQAINNLPQARFIARTTNIGSAANRNYLASVSQYPWLLFIDCDVTIQNPQFLYTYYIYMAQNADVINGGIAVATLPEMAHNLRYQYEKDAEPAHSAENRQKNKYQEFRSTNFMIRREAFFQCPFDERFTMSGYEDVLFGKQLKQQHIAVLHIDNPVVMTEFEQNADYMNKTERNLRTLYTFRNELRGYSRLLTLVQGIHISAILWLIRLWHRMFGATERRNLCGSRPLLSLYQLYRLGYYLTLLKHREG